MAVPAGHHPLPGVRVEPARAHQVGHQPGHPPPPTDLRDHRITHVTAARAAARPGPPPPRRPSPPPRPRPGHRPRDHPQHLPGAGVNLAGGVCVLRDVVQIPARRCAPAAARPRVPARPSSTPASCPPRNVPGPDPGLRQRTPPHPPTPTPLDRPAPPPPSPPPTRDPTATRSPSAVALRPPAAGACAAPRRAADRGGVGSSPIPSPPPPPLPHARSRSLRPPPCAAPRRDGQPGQRGCLVSRFLVQICHTLLPHQQYHRTPHRRCDSVLPGPSRGQQRPARCAASDPGR